MNIRRFVTAAICIAACALTGCKVTYSLSGASIPANAKTVSIPYFPNNATLVSPTLSSTLTDELQTRFTNQTKLELVPENGDLAFEGGNHELYGTAGRRNQQRHGRHEPSDDNGQGKVHEPYRPDFRFQPFILRLPGISLFKRPLVSGRDAHSGIGDAARGRHLQCGSIELVAP